MLVNNEAFMIPSPTDLTYFIEVASLQNLSHAAENLGVSQPSLTLAMRRLERAVETKILIRHKRGVTLTKAGKQLLVNTRQLMQHWDLIKSKTLDVTNEVRGVFTIGCHPSVGIYSLSHFLPDLLLAHPNLEIRLKHDLSRKITDEVIRLNIDIGITVNPVRHPDLVIKTLYEDKFTFWQASSKRQNHNLASGRALLICDPELNQTQALLKKLKKHGLSSSRILTTSSLEVIADLTATGCGIGVLPASLAATRKLTMVPKTPFYRDEICVLYHGENREIKAIQVITQAVKKMGK